MLPSDAPPLPPPVPVEISLSAESAAVNDGQRMGLVGLSYQRPWGSNLWGGMSVYGASTGNRGGFFAWGLSSAYRTQGGPWQAEAGLFLGGGGGSPGWVGSGLMLRPHLEVDHAWGPLSLGLGVAGLWFPDGRVHTAQPYASLRWTSNAYLLSGNAPPAGSLNRNDDIWAADTDFTAVLGRYRMSSSPRRDRSVGHSDMQVGGLSFRRALPVASILGGQPFALLTTLGAIGGGYDGYAELTGGVGLQWQLMSSVTLRAEAAAGSAGAGATVDTGGGLVGKLGAALEWQPARDWSVAARIGRLHSRGLFQATETRLELAYRFRDAVPAAGTGSQTPFVTGHGGSTLPEAWQWSPWDLSVGLFNLSRMPRAVGEPSALGLLGLKLEREFGTSWRWTGQAATGVAGHAGGYASGQLGLGWLSPGAGDGLCGWRLGGEAALGAAGGGGVEVLGGLFAQAQLQARYRVAPEWSVQLDAGRLLGVHGNWTSPVLGLSLISHFSRLEGH